LSLVQNYLVTVQTDRIQMKMISIWGQIYRTQHTICNFLNQGMLSVDKKMSPTRHTSETQSSLSTAE
jgi:hypothetical protein